MIAGLDLSAPEWRFIEAPLTTNTGPAGWGPREVVSDNETAGFWNRFEEPLRLFGPPKLNRPRSERNWLDAVAESAHASLRLPPRFDVHQHQFVVAIPYAVSPVARLALPQLLVAPRSPAPKAYAACEAPLALALELLAENLSDGRSGGPPWRGQLVTPAGSDFELTTLEIAKNGRELQIDFVRSLRLPATSRSVDNLCEKINADAERTAGTRNPRPASRNGRSSHEPTRSAEPMAPAQRWDGDWFVAGPELESIARPIFTTVRQQSTAGAATSTPAFLVADPWAIAHGAARYASLIFGQRSRVPPLLGGIKSLSCSRVLSRPLGIVGVNAKGEAFWRRLFHSGQSCSSDLGVALKASPGSSGSSPCVLAESTTADPPLWLTVDEWKKTPLLMHSSHEIAHGSLAGKESQLRFQLRVRDHLRLWDDLFVRIAWT